jgi:hypothetical protein
MMNQFFYSKLTDGVPSAPIFSAAVGPVTGLNKPLDICSDAELAEHGFVRVVAPPYPQDGYRYEMSVPREDGGVWKVDWVQLPTPLRDETMAKLAKQRRDDRNALLATTDWTQLADAALTVEKKAEWAQYRQALRDIPNKPNFPWVVDLPVRPS